MEGQLINIGRVVGSFGVRGAVKVVPLTDFPQRFRKMRSVLINVRGKVAPIKIEWTKEHGSHILIKFASIDSPEDALQLKGAYLQVTEKDLYPLPEGEYYIFQLIGLKVYDRERGYLGEIAEVLQTGANDVYVVEGGPYGEVLIPVLKQVVLSVDLNIGRVEVSLLPGLIEEEK